MLSRGWTGTMPAAGRPARAAELAGALLPGLAMVLVATLALGLR